MIVSGPIKGRATEAISRSSMLQGGDRARRRAVDEAFVCVIAPGWLDHFIYNEYYKTDEEFVFALAEALRDEYRAIVDAGFILQIDDPGLVDWWDMLKPEPSVEDYRNYRELRIEAINHALEASRRTACAITSAGAAGTARTPTTCRSSTSSTSCSR